MSLSQSQSQSRFLNLVLLIFVFFASVSAWDINSAKDRKGCQARTGNPLEGCDTKRTLYVNGASNSSEFRTVQSGMYSSVLGALEFEVA